MIRRMLADNAIERTTEANVTKFKEAPIAWLDKLATINEVKTAKLPLENLKQVKTNSFAHTTIIRNDSYRKLGKRTFRKQIRPRHSQ